MELSSAEPEAAREEAAAWGAAVLSPTRVP